LTARWLVEPGIHPRAKLERGRTVVATALTFSRGDLSLALRELEDELARVSLAGSGESGELTHTPVLIICRDLLSPLQKLISWLEERSLTNIVLLDNDSSYPPLLRFFEESPHQVIPLGDNVGAEAPWKREAIPLLAHGGYLIVTDPDILPVEDCPADFLERWLELHTRYASCRKIGFGLKIDDIPDHYRLKDEVIEWEAQFWRVELEKDVYFAAIDTTFALYKPGAYDYFRYPAIRTGGRYMARHVPWYADSDELSAEQSYYREHGSAAITSWTGDRLPTRYGWRPTEVQREAGEAADLPESD
jgi:hypothetical protein